MKNILNILRYHNGASRLLREIESNKITLASIIANAADEIEKLRAENKQLKKELRKKRG